MTEDIIPLTNLAVVNNKVVRDGALQRIASVAQSNQFVDGFAVECFEERWAEYCGARYCVGVGTGTDAVELAVRAVYGRANRAYLNVPASTFCATLFAVIRAGENVALCDVDDETLMVECPDVAVGLYGQELLLEPSEPIVIDAAQMHGIRTGWAPAAWSFFPTKNLGCWGDGGAVTTDDEGLAEEIRAMSRQGDKGRVGPAFNSRLDTIQSCVLLEKLPFLDEWVEARRQAAGSYRRRLKGMGLDVIGDDRSAFHLIVTRVENRSRVREEMKKRGVETGVHYPLALSEFGWAKPFLVEEPACPTAQQAAREVLSLPLWPGMSPYTIDRVVNVLGESIQEVTS